MQVTIKMGGWTRQVDPLGVWVQLQKGRRAGRGGPSTSPLGPYYTTDIWGVGPAGLTLWVSGV